MTVSQDTFFRSADMSLTQLFVAKEIKREVVGALGELGLCHFRDLNSGTSAFQKAFTQEIRRIDNVERQLRYFRTQMDKASIPMRSSPDLPEVLHTPLASEIDELAERCENLEHRIIQLNDSYEGLKKQEIELYERRWVLSEAGGFFDRAIRHADEIRQSFDDQEPLLRDVEQQQDRSTLSEPNQQALAVMNIGFVAGVIERDRMGPFERILWRTLRGNLYMNQSEIPKEIVDPITGERVHKNVFLIFAHGREVVSKIRKISESMGAHLYNVDENGELRRDQAHDVNTRITEVDTVLQTTRITLDTELNHIGRNLAAWMIIIKKEKGVYQTLNLFASREGQSSLIAEAWCPNSSLPAIKATLQDVNDRAGLPVPTVVNLVKTNKTPPTYMKTNKFTEGFQTIIDAYGTSKYGEVNPGLPTIITFPFLFAVMFGDLGHGALMTMAALAMIIFEEKLSRAKIDELTSMAFYGRYIMLMMGVFSMYTGLIYNDIFSKPLTLWDSAWHWPKDFREGELVTASLKGSGRYPFGLDWGWHDTDNSLLFANSYKMKLSILLGWAHMTYSLCLSYFNSRHFKKPIEFWGNLVPGMIFFQSIFGYLSFTIVFKWSIDWFGRKQSPPGLLNMLIFMFLSPGTVNEKLYTGQSVVQVGLLGLALIQVPILLLLKPLYLRWENNRAHATGHRDVGSISNLATANDSQFSLDSHAGALDDTDTGPLLAEARESIGDDAVVATSTVEEGEEHEEFEFSEVMIHQIIHTIEFCLNCVSHTASYLRLWALSLAHQQLSIVLWKMTLFNAFTQPSNGLRVVLIVITFFMWFTLTVAVLCIMEGTSAMLHSLRLHWVEAMSKHFIGDGVAFTPFSFKRMLEEDPID